MSYSLFVNIFQKLRIYWTRSNYREWWLTVSLQWIKQWLASYKTIEVHSIRNAFAPLLDHLQTNNLELQSWTKVPGTVLQYPYFSVISRFPLKTVQLSVSSCSSPSPHPIQSWNSEKILDTRVQHCLWGEGRSWTWVKWKTPQKPKNVPRLLSMIVRARSLGNLKRR